MMKSGRSLPLYMRIFIAVGLVVIVFQSFFTFYLIRNLHAQYLKDTIDKSRSIVATSRDQLQMAWERMSDTAYSLIYCDINQAFMNMPSNVKESERIKKQDALQSLLMVTQNQKHAGTDFILYSTGVGGTYSTVSTRAADVSGASFDFSGEEWFYDFLTRPFETNHFYPNVAFPSYSRYTRAGLHVRLFRVNPLHDTVKSIGYLALVITDELFENLLRSLNEVSTDVLLLNRSGNCIYESMSMLDREALCAQAAQNPDHVYSLPGNRYNYIPMSTPIGGTDWTLYCTIDVTHSYAGLQHSYATWIILSCALLLCLLLLIYQLCRRLTLPLKRVVDGMARVQGGDYSIQLDETGNDEINVLTTAFNDMAHQLDDAHRNLRKYQLIQQSTAFYALQQQVNPHMLFNTLDMMIGMATQKDFDSIISACSCLASMFRYSLSRDLTVPLGDELSHIRSYIELLSLRNCGRLRGEIECPDAEARTLIPKLILQPFVENSIKYAFNQNVGSCLVRVRVERSWDFLTVSIRDNGGGFPLQMLDEFAKVIDTPFDVDVPDRHIGILNVCKRMKLIYGHDFSIVLENLPEGGAAVTLRFPPDFPKTVI